MTTDARRGSRLRLAALLAASDEAYRRAQTAG